MFNNINFSRSEAEVNDNPSSYISGNSRVNLLAYTLSSISECVSITDMENRILYVNRAFLDTYGYKESEILGKNIEIIRSPNNDPSVAGSILNNTIGGTWKGELLNIKKDGTEFPVSISASTVYDESGKPVALVGIAADITKQKNTEAELIQAKEDAEKSNRLKSEFLAQMSHEIRTPINSILSFSSLLKDELLGKIPDDLHSIFNIIDNGGRRLIRTIDMILHMSEFQTGNYDYYPVDVDLANDVIESVFNEFKPVAKEKELEYKLIKQVNSSVIHSDPYTLEQIFSNLIDNAIKYTPKGKVEVKLYRTPQNKTAVDIKDTGIGISEEFLPCLFTPFSQEETGYTRRFEGNGLGLALVRKYLELNDADISVSSEKNKGSVFTITFSS